MWKGSAVESGGLFSFNKLMAHRTQTQTANTIDVRAKQNTASCSTVSEEKRTIANDLERKMTRKSRAACKGKEMEKDRLLQRSVGPHVQKEDMSEQM